MKIYQNIYRIIILASIAFIVFVGAHAITKRKTKRKRTKNSFIHGGKKQKILPPSFGKTHFIVGFDHNAYQTDKKSSSENLFKNLFSDDGRIKRALFAPDDSIRQTLINLIEQEEDSLKIAIFAFTDQKVAEALIRASKRGINVEIITDPNTIHSPTSKITYLAKHGIQIYTYKPKKRSLLGDKMHDKFILFGKNILERPLLWTGSYNFTKAAGADNQENVIILDDQSLIIQFNNQYDRLKQRTKNLPSHYKSHKAQIFQE